MTTTAAKPQRVLLIGFDGVDSIITEAQFKENKLPFLKALFEGGASGPLKGSNPIINASAWTTLATGIRPEYHGIVSERIPNDDRKGTQAVTSVQWEASPFWKTIKEQGLKTQIFGWPASHPLTPEVDVGVSNAFPDFSEKSWLSWPLKVGAAQPKSLEKTLGKKRVHPTQVDPTLLELMLPHYSKKREHEVPLFRLISQNLAQSESVQAAALHSLESHPWDFAAIYYPSIGKLLRDFLKYHPPKHPKISISDFERYKHIVEHSLQHQEKQIQEICKIAGDNTLIVLCSAYGYASGKNRVLTKPGENTTQFENRRYPGFISFSGHGIKQNEKIEHANLLDIAPTILGAIGITIPPTMQGQLLEDIFEIPPRQKKEESTFQQPVITAPKLEKPPDSQTVPHEYLAWETQAQNLYQLGLFCFDSGKTDRALQIFENICERQPWRVRPFIEQIRCHMRLGNIEQAREILKNLTTREERGAAPLSPFRPLKIPEFDLINGLLDYAEGDYQSAETNIKKAKNKAPNLPGCEFHLAKIYIKQKQWHLAIEAFEKSLQAEQATAHTYYGLARAYYEMGDHPAAQENLQKTLQLSPSSAEAWFLLGLACSKQKQHKIAIKHFEKTLELSPQMSAARKALTHLKKLQNTPKPPAPLPIPSQ